MQKKILFIEDEKDLVKIVVFRLKAGGYEVITAYDKMKDMFKMEGVKDYITKPFDDKDLLLRISRALK